MSLASPSYRWPAVALGLLVALLGALLFVALGTPLPWLMGALIVTAATRIRGIPSACPPTVSRAGQWVIGLSLGLYFTPMVAAHVVDHAGLVVLSVVYALFLGLVGSALLRRYAGLDGPTAWFAAAVGGASEMTHLAQQHGGRVDLVAAAHSLRVLMVVVILPFGLQWLMGSGARPAAGGTTLALPVLAWLAPVTLLGALLLSRLRVPNPWVLGPLLLAAIFTLQDMTGGTLPAPLSWAGQLAIGWSLGDRFRPGFFRTAPRVLALVAVGTLLTLVLSALMAWGLSGVTGQPVTTLLLSLAPGGIAEMTLTAKALGLGVPLVTAMHVVRLLVVVLTAGPLYQWWRRR